MVILALYICITSLGSMPFTMQGPLVHEVGKVVKLFNIDHKFTCIYMYMVMFFCILNCTIHRGCLLLCNSMIRGFKYSSDIVVAVLLLILVLGFPYSLRKYK